MTQEQQPKALLVADQIGWLGGNMAVAASELRRQHARIAEMEAELEAVGAGGVEPLRKGFVRLSDVLARLEQGFGANSAPVTTIKRHFEMQAATAHPAESVPAQIETLRSELAEEKEAADNWRRLAMQFDNHRMQAIGHLKAVTNPDACFDKYKAAKEFLNAPPLDGEAVLAQRIAALAATQPAAQEMEKSACGYPELPAGSEACEFNSYAIVYDADEMREYVDADRRMRAALAAQAKQGGA